jgi:predicted aldo/keto reductase-like oxidoreductase
MRLPTLNGTKEVDEKEAARLLHYAIDHGVNYVDTAWTYHSGDSERFLGRALEGGYRDKVKVADKMPARIVNAPEDFDRFFNEQMRRLGIDHVKGHLLCRWPFTKQFQSLKPKADIQGISIAQAAWHNRWL